MVKAVKSDKTFSIIVVREVARIETVEMIVHAESKEAASDVALSFASGEDPQWPSVQRYSLTNIEPLDAEVVSIDFIDR